MAKNSIGQFIAALRKANGMTQQDVADRLNVSNKAVSRWERDECAPDLSVIPALAEMFGVTCDELLKGERILESMPVEKKEPKVEKQIKNLITRTLSGFKTLIWISLAVAIVGLVCMFGISYGFYRPVIGFAVMLLFEACAFTIAVLAVNRTRDVKTDNELFEMADEGFVSRFNNTLGSFSFVSFFVILAVILLSLPLILTTSDYVNSVVTPYSYFTVFFGGIVLLLFLIYLKCRKIYIVWITENRLPQKVEDAVAKNRKTMTFIQVGLTILAGVIFVLAPYLEFNPTGSFSLFDVGIIVGLLCLAASIGCFIVFLIRQKDRRKELVLPGIRNILLIPSAIIVPEMHYVIWVHFGSEPDYAVDALERRDIWNMEYLWYAIALVAIVVIVFSLIEIFITKRKK